jgi:hypothetical protein
MACDRFTRELKDHALGAPLGTAAAAHLAVCSACQALFARETRLMATIGAAIEQVGSARPAADYQARLREGMSRPTQSMRGRWYLAAAALAVAALSVFVVRIGWPRQRAGDASAVRSSLAIVKDTPPLRVMESPTRAATAGQSVRPRNAQANVRATAHTDVLDVLVPAGQPEVIARLMASLNAQEPDVASRLVGRAVTRRGIAQFAEAPVSVAPILIEAVDVPELPAPEPVRTN